MGRSNGLLDLHHISFSGGTPRGLSAFQVTRGGTDSVAAALAFTVCVMGGWTDYVVQLGKSLGV